MADIVYILINPSMQGLLKIGMTTRSSEERAAELSAGTNMPTKFVVAYEVQVSNGREAEKAIHNALAVRGYRVSDNREFFSIPLKAAIQVVSDIAANFDSRTAPDESISPEYHLQKGLQTLTGSDNEQQNYDNAHYHFQRAIELGNIEAYYWLALLYMEGFGVMPSFERAIAILNQGVSRGNHQCYVRMWEIYSGNTRLSENDPDKADVCFAQYIDAEGQNAKETFISEYISHWVEKSPATTGKCHKINDLPGKHSARCFRLLIERTRSIMQTIRNARLEGASLAECEKHIKAINIEFDRYALPALVAFIMTLVVTHQLEMDIPGIVKEAMLGMTKEDIEYALAGMKEEHLQRYISYIST